MSIQYDLMFHNKKIVVDFTQSKALFANGGSSFILLFRKTIKINFNKKKLAVKLRSHDHIHRKLAGLKQWRSEILKCIYTFPLPPQIFPSCFLLRAPLAIPTCR